MHLALELQAEFDDAGLDNCRAMPLRDGFSSLFSLFKPGQGQGDLPQYLVPAVLHSLVLDSKEKYPVLSGELGLSSSQLGNADGAASLRSFIDAVRLNDSQDGAINKAIDEYGEVNQEGQRVAELIELLQDYQNYQSDKHLFDSVGRREELLHLLDLVGSSEQVPPSMPEQIVLYLPSHLYPLECLIIQRLSQILSMVVIADNYLITKGNVELEGHPYQGLEILPPSVRYSSSVGRFLTSALAKKVQVIDARPCSIDRSFLCQAAIDGVLVEREKIEHSDSCARIEVWETGSRFEEIKRAADLILQLRDLEPGEMSQIQIVAPQLESYVEFIEQVFGAKDIPYAIPKGVALGRTSAGASFQAYLGFLHNPSLASVTAYFESELVRPLGLEEAGKGAFREEYNNELKQVFTLPLWQAVSKPPGDDNEPIESQGIDLSLLSNEAERLGLSLDLSDFSTFVKALTKHFVHLFSYPNPQNAKKQRLESLRQRKEAAVKFLTLVDTLAALRSEMELRERLVSDAADYADTVQQLWRAFWNRRRALSNLKRQALEVGAAQRIQSDFLEQAKAMRRLGQVVRGLVHDFRQLELPNSTFSVPQERWKSAVEQLRLRVLGSFYNTTQCSQSITFTEFLDLRGIGSKKVIILGLNESAFPAAGGDSALITDDTACATEYIKRFSHDSSSLYESYWLLGSVIRNADSLVLSFANEDERGEHNPSHILVKLHALGLKYKGPEILALEAQDCVPEANSRGAKSLEQRESYTFSCYDGFLGPEWIELGQELAPRSFCSNGVSRFAITELEQYQECPHRFFFSRVLGLEKPQVPFAEEVKRHVGIAVHRALDRFFRAPGLRDASLPLRDEAGNLSADALGLMYRVACSVLSESEVDWSSHPVLRNAVNEIMDGLSGSSAKKGYLRAALEYQVSILETFPLVTEYHFGFGESCETSSALRIPEIDPVVELSGVIDRIDGEMGNSDAGFTAVWDYKTGKPATILAVDRHKSLQLPLYAAALKQNFGAKAKLARGGCIYLGSPNMPLEPQGDLAKKVLIEHLGLKSGSQSLVLDSSHVDERIEHAKAAVLEINDRVLKGEFFQTLETKTCDFCAFQAICARSEAALERKSILDQQQSNALFTRTTETSLVLSTSVLPSCLGTARIELSDEQELASDVSKSVALIAGAGSGKTAVLRTRVLRLLAAGVEIDKVLAITFTEKAAREIKSRIQSGIAQALQEGVFDGQPLDSKSTYHLIEADASMAEAEFSTIHSFAANVVRADSILSGGIGSNRVLEGGEASELRRRAVEQCLDEAEQKQGDTSVDFLLSKGVSFKNLKAELIRLTAQPAKLQSLSKTFGGLENEATAQGFKDSELGAIIAKAYSTEIGALKKDFKTNGEEWIAGLRDWLDLTQTKERWEPRRLRPFVEFAELISDLLQIEAAEDWLEKVSEIRAWAHANNSAMLKKSKANLRNFWKDMRDSLDGLAKRSRVLDWEFEQVGVQVVKEVCALASRSCEVYSQFKDELGAVDFDDLISTAHRMICGRFSGPKLVRQNRLRARLRSQYRHIMVDEFQDTDRFQWEMVRELAALGQNEPGEANIQTLRSLFVVGDQKQSIYGFRSSDPQVFIDAASYINQHGGATCSLTNNYRSRPSLVDAVNTLFEPILGSDFDERGDAISSGAVAFQAMCSKISEKAPEPAVFALAETDGAKSYAHLSPKRKEARTTAAFVEEVVKDYRSNSGQWPRLQSVASGPVVAVLTRSVKDLVSIARELELRGVEFGVSHSTGFYQLDEILQLENLLKALRNPEDSISLVGVLRSALFGYSDLELSKLLVVLGSDWANLWDSAALNCQSSEVSDLAKQLQRWRALVHLLGPAKFLQRITQELELDKVYSMANKLEASSNIQRLIEVLRHAEMLGYVRANLDGALSWFVDQKSEMRHAPNSNSLAHPVVLTTVHGAKGLEYPMVVLPFLQRKPKSDGDFVVGAHELGAQSEHCLMGAKLADPKHGFERKLTTLGATLASGLKERDTAEERRVFYVACTRAEDYLVLGMPLPSNFATEQKKYEDYDQIERKQQLRANSNPIRWLRLLGRVDDLKSPSKWQFETPAGSPLEVPII